MGGETMGRTKIKAKLCRELFALLSLPSSLPFPNHLDAL